MKQSIFGAIVAAMAIAVFLTFNYNQSGAQSAPVHATPAAMMQGACAHTSAMGTSAECPYAHTASMQSGQCPYAAECSNGANCPHANASGANASGASMNAGSHVQVVPVTEKISAKSEACPAGCPASMCSGHHATASK